MTIREKEDFEVEVEENPEIVKIQEPRKIPTPEPEPLESPMVS